MMSGGNINTEEEDTHLLGCRQTEDVESERKDELAVAL